MRDQVSVSKTYAFSRRLGPEYDADFPEVVSSIIPRVEPAVAASAQFRVEPALAILGCARPAEREEDGHGKSDAVDEEYEPSRINQIYPARIRGPLAAHNLWIGIEIISTIRLLGAIHGLDHRGHHSDVKDCEDHAQALNRRVKADSMHVSTSVPTVNSPL